MAGLVAGAPSLVIAIGDIVIENQPPGAKELIVELFGSNNKLALNVGIVITAILIAGLLGVAGRRNWIVPVVGFVRGRSGGPGRGADPAADRPACWRSSPSSLAIGIALAALRLMLRLTGPAWRARCRRDAATRRPPRAASMPDWDRRRFLQVGGGVAVGAILLGVVGRNLLTEPRRGRRGGAPSCPRRSRRCRTYPPAPRSRSRASRPSSSPTTTSTASTPRS